jgi:starch-binding outer membrane protein SusE/F
MKNFKIFSAVLLIAVLFSTACRKKAVDRNFLSGKEISPELTLMPGSDSIILMMDKADMEAVGMTWTAADWGFPAGTNYNVEIVKQGADWSTAKVINLGVVRKAMLTHFDLNAAANAFGIAPQQSGVLSSRIKAFVPGNAAMIYSNVVNRTVVAYKMDIPMVTVTPIAEAVILKIDSALMPAITMNWTPVNWNNPTTTEYQLEMIRKGSPWTSAKIIPISGTNYSITHKALNVLMLGEFGTDTLGTDSISYRIKASMPGTSRMVYSDVISKLITTYKMVFETNKIYIPGDYQGWNHNPLTVQYLEETTPGSSKFKAIVEKTKADGSLSSGGFKFTPMPNWDYDFGDNGTNYSSLLSGNGSIGPKSNGTNGNNFSLPDGTYEIMMDTTNTVRSWSYVLKNWAVTGDATALSWPSGPGGTPGQDQNMRYNQKTKLYEIELPLIAGKSIKLRANDDWGTNLGNPTGADGDPVTLGTAIGGVQGGKNWGIVTAGNYKITLDPETNEVKVVKLP